MEDIGVEGRMILKCILKIFCEGVGTGFFRIRIGTIDRFYERGKESFS
jgi:hypothetical protein